MARICIPVMAAGMSPHLVSMFLWFVLWAPADVEQSPLHTRGGGLMCSLCDGVPGGGFLIII